MLINFVLFFVADCSRNWTASQSCSSACCPLLPLLWGWRQCLYYFGELFQEGEIVVFFKYKLLRFWFLLTFVLNVRAWCTSWSTAKRWQSLRFATISGSWLTACGMCTEWGSFTEISNWATCSCRRTWRSRSGTSAWPPDWTRIQKCEYNETGINLTIGRNSTFIYKLGNYI